MKPIKKTALITASLTMVCCLVLAPQLNTQNVPEDELQIIFNGYFDSFHVNVLYPSISLTKRVSGSLSINGRYVVDAVSAASMKSRFDVDGISSATHRDHGGSESSPDELRHEFNVGLTQKLGKGTVSVNGIYSTEHDYTSTTLTGRINYPFAKNNTTIGLGVVKSWDKVFPQTRNWKKDKDVLTLSASITQVLGRKMIAQADFSYTDMSGMLTDVYQVVTIIYPDQLAAIHYEPVHPSERERKAVGLRFKNLIAPLTSLELGYRYYWDTWDITSHTISGKLQKMFAARRLTLGLALRYYTQTRASFFKPTYMVPEPLMSVDSKLDSGQSWDAGLSAHINGRLFGKGFFGMKRENMDLTLNLNIYHRRTDSPDWHSRSKTLTAVITGIGLRYRF